MSILLTAAPGSMFAGLEPIIEPLSYIFVPVIGVLVLKEKISKRRLLGIAIMFVGIAVFSM